MKRRTFAALLVLAGLACQGDPSSSVAGVTLDLAVTRTTLQRGELDTLTMTVTNTNAYPVSLSGGACEPSVYVVDGRGTTVVPAGGGWVCIMVIRALRLAPGERYARSYVWQTDSLPAGVYRAHATFETEELRLATKPIAVQLN